MNFLDLQLLCLESLDVYMAKFGKHKLLCFEYCFYVTLLS